MVIIFESEVFNPSSILEEATRVSFHADAIRKVKYPSFLSTAKRFGC